MKKWVKISGLLICSFGLNGCLSIAGFPEKPVSSTEAETLQSDDMPRKCKDTKRNRKNRLCVIIPKD